MGLPLMVTLDQLSVFKAIFELIKMLLIHGSVDQRVPPAHVRKYMNQLDKYGKPYKYVELVCDNQ